MPRLRLPATTPAEFAEGLAAIRTELAVPSAFPATVDAAGETAAARGPTLPPGVPDEPERADRHSPAPDPGHETDGHDQARRSPESRLHTPTRPEGKSRTTAIRVSPSASM